MLCRLEAVMQMLFLQNYHTLSFSLYLGGKYECQMLSILHVGVNEYFFANKVGNLDCGQFLALF